MKWNKFRLTTTTEAEDIVSSMLMDLGIQGIEIEDKVPLTQSDKEQMFVDILPETEADEYHGAHLRLLPDNGMIHVQTSELLFLHSGTLLSLSDPK